MTWNAFHSRGDILRDVIRAADDRRDGVLPTDLPGVEQKFTDEIDLMGALLLKWHARLSGNLERALTHEPMDLESAVASAWRTTADQMPGLRLVIDRATELPETAEMGETMARARRREHARLAQAAGLASDRSDRAVEVGRRIEEHARTGLPLAAPVRPARTTPVRTEVVVPRQPVRDETPVTRTVTTSHERESFVERIKAVLAA